MISDEKKSDEIREAIQINFFLQNLDSDPTGEGRVVMAQDPCSNPYFDFQKYV